MGLSIISFAVVILTFLNASQSSDDVPALEVTVQSLAQQVSMLSAKLAALEASHNKDRMSVAFHAEFSADPVQLGPQAPLILDRVTTNVGNGYDVSTGFFRAPASGTYMFVVNYMGAINIYIYVCIFVDSTEVDYSISHGDGSHWDHVSESIVLHLQEGQRVHLQHCDTSQKEIRGSHWSTFSGFLIQSDT